MFKTKNIYIISSMAFLFVVLKYLFTDITPTSAFIIYECISVFLFLILVYLFDSYIARVKKQRDVEIDEYISKIDKLEKNCLNLQNIVDDYRKVESDEKQYEDKISKLKQSIELYTSVVDKKHVVKCIMSDISKTFEVGAALFFVKQINTEEFKAESTYGVDLEQYLNKVLPEGLGLQCLKDKSPFVLKDIDKGTYQIESASGMSDPNYLYFLPVLEVESPIALVEIASFRDIKIDQHWESISESILKALQE